MIQKKNHAIQFYWLCKLSSRAPCITSAGINSYKKECPKLEPLIPTRKWSKRYNSIQDSGPHVEAFTSSHMVTFQLEKTPTYALRLQLTPVYLCGLILWQNHIFLGTAGTDTEVSQDQTCTLIYVLPRCKILSPFQTDSGTPAAVTACSNHNPPNTWGHHFVLTGQCYILQLQSVWMELRGLGGYTF